MEASARHLLENLDKLPPEHYEAVTQALAKWTEARRVEGAKDDFLSFVRAMWPPFIEGPHHRIMAEKFEKVANGELKRIIINIAPRHGKSELTSWLLPAWMLGRDPSKKIIAATHTADFSVRFGRKVRNLIDTEAFKTVFPNVTLRADSKAAGRWDVSGLSLIHI